VEETDEEVVIRVEAPGFELDEFDVRRLGNFLNIRAEHLLGQVRLAVPLPPGLAQAEAGEMAYHDGELVLRLPRKPEAAGLPPRGRDRKPVPPGCLVKRLGDWSVMSTPARAVVLQRLTSAT
jgi:HSP20 family molecular chaperone IbpA